MEEKIAIIGAGEIGQAIAFLLKKKNIIANLWDKDPQKNLLGKSLEEVVKEATVLFICVPSWVVVEALQSVIPFLSPQTLVVSLTKGISQTSQKTVDVILQEMLPKNNSWVLLAGPMLAEEIKRDLKGAAVVASQNMEAFNKLNSLFSPELILQNSADTKSVAFASVLKNIYALGLGITSGLSWGGNLQGNLLSQAILEMLSIAKKLNLSTEVMLGRAGLGDLIATGFSQYSLNHQTGTELVNSGQCSRMCEGVASLEPLVKILNEDLITWPILKSLSLIITHQKSAKDAFQGLIS